MFIVYLSQMTEFENSEQVNLIETEKQRYAGKLKFQLYKNILLNF